MWHWARLSAQKPRHIILHYHIFKNAGTTIYSILQRNFGKRLAPLESKHFNSTLANEALIAFLQKHPKIKAVSSHHLVPPKPVDPSFVFHDILFLRHPLARFSSMYDFYRRADVTDDPLSLEAHRRTTAEFMRLLIEEHPGHVSNVQVAFLSRRDRRSDESMLDSAVRVAGQASVLGLAEAFDIGAVQAEHTLSPVFPRINFGYVAQNVSSMAPRVLSTHLKQFQDACGDEIYNRLLQLNALDLLLLERITAEVNRRFRAIPNHETRLREFMLWRSILHPSAIRGVLASNHPHNFVHYANLGAK